MKICSTKGLIISSPLAFDPPCFSCRKDCFLLRVFSLRFGVIIALDNCVTQRAQVTRLETLISIAGDMFSFLGDVSELQSTVAYDYALKLPLFGLLELIF